MASRFLEALNSGRVLLMDGAMGTELRRAGLPEAACGEMWNLTQPQRVRAIHQAYADAGAECLLTNTFQANPPALQRHGVQDRIEEITEAAVRLAGAVAGPDRFVLADIGPVVDPQAPEALSGPQAVERVLPELKRVDGVLLETYSDPMALFTVRHCRVASWMEGVPILLSLCYQRDPSGGLCTHSRHPPEWFALQARQYGVAALGVNCGRDLGMDDMIEIIRRYRRVTDLPLFARPNAGTPARQGDGWVWPHTPAQMAARLPELLDAGVCMVGGCCGTTPAHIAAFRLVIDQWNARHAREGKGP
jgi:5-methyltetrahydrofolate--homocysteine methyltransferase